MTAHTTQDDRPGGGAGGANPLAQHTGGDLAACVATATHKLNNHWQTVLGYLDVAIEETPEDSDTAYALRQALSAAESGAEVTGRLQQHALTGSGNG